MMMPFRSLRRRSPKELGIRLALAAVATVLCYMALVQSLAMVVQKKAPGRAHLLAPGNGFITGRLAGELAGPTADAGDRARADRLARLALRQDPTALGAVVALGIDAQIRGHTQAARRFYTYAEALSRRNLQTQIWAIGNEIARDNIPAVLTHYDIALRTSRPAEALLFPTLASAIVDPAIRAALVHTLSRQPPWGDAFISYAISNGADSEATASLLAALSRRGVAISDGASSSVVDALFSAGKTERAWSYYAATHPGADRRRSRDPDFESTTTLPSVFDWTPVNDDSISAAIQPNAGGGGVLTFAAPASIGGVAAQQIELLPPGGYVLTGRTEGIDQADDAHPYWTLVCSGGDELGRVELQSSTVANGRFAGRITVPAGCPVQVLTLNLRPSSNISGVSGQIDRALLRPAR